MVASADIGLVLNQPVQGNRYAQRNVQIIGLSSGRFSIYLKHGLAVLSIRQACYSKLLEDYAFGEDLGSFAELPQALSRVKSRLAEHSAEAKRLFSEKLDFDVHWPRLSKRLREIMR
jgi:hypothetical protein